MKISEFLIYRLVCHRLDDLEKQMGQQFWFRNVCHRLDDLENIDIPKLCHNLVCHRLDDLEILYGRLYHSE